MNNTDFIIHLCKEIWSIISDGNEPDLNLIESELRNRGINPDEIFVY